LTRLPLFSKGEEEYAASLTNKRNWTTWRILVRLFAEAHLRRILRALERAYVLTGRTYPVTSQERVWFSEAEEDVQAFAAQLGAFQRVKLVFSSLWARH
jgi:hypothetical protein